MTELRGFVYDGQTAARRAVTVKLSVPGYLTVQGFGSLARYPLDELDVSPRLGSQPAVVELPGGGRLEVADADAFYAALDSSPVRHQWQHAIESRRGLLVLITLLALAFGWLVYDRGIPAVARQAAMAVPAEMDQQIGVDGLALLDQQVFGPSTLSADARRQIEGAMLEVIAVVGDDQAYQLEFRAGNKVGPNAFALPAGIVIVTDELVALTEDTSELQAILAHEIGHVLNRHALRTLLQGSVVTGLLAVMSGDAAAAGGLAAAIPATLARAGYSRQFEYEADAVAKRYLLATDTPLTAFTAILARLEAQGGGDAVPGLLRTHPVTRDRLEQFLQ